ncbi:MAG TPA: prepilin-type N-terminal cleavage/methylation domain-containing protein [Pseudomonas xinjiangensis]|uniref:Prepilin-type N-terminal cleavage/methylation domain-containing protein n=2 Tax=root TaxID=1 RepID=A0A7V1BNS0_9GAMM|nr:prepilin-type N-terminal cleavage/methylation domain-containing protein [Halopseudomonas xinjiangensis]HEC48694.1 prepilin-type N-terminal cleavage/methylation domain-containing protein [Halopseudomonas xinjiangensis]
MTKHRQKGVTLVELMVSLIIGLVLTGAVIQVYLSNSITFRLQEGMSKVQESGRLALQYMARELREAGTGLEFSIGATPTACMVDKDTCDGYLVSGLFGEIAPSSGDAIPGSDIVTIGGTDSCDAQLDGVYKPNSANFKASKFCDSMKKGSVLMLVDFKQAVIFSVNNSPSAGGNITINHSGPANVVSNKLGGVVFDDGARVMGFSNQSYLVRNTGLTDAAGFPIRALAVRNNLATNPSASIVDLVDGVEDMRAFYGVPNGAELDYKRANEITAADQWAEVRAVRLELLLVSDTSALGTESQSIDFGGNAVPSDGRFREVYSTVAAIRNRVN